MGTLSGKVAWVTGAGTGIGLAGAQALATSGALVVMSGRRGDVLEREAGAIRKGGGKAEVEVLDVSDAAAVKQTAERILGRHGRVDVLVNSAGLNNPQRFWRDQTVDSWDQVIRINLDGTSTAPGRHPRDAQSQGWPGDQYLLVGGQIHFGHGRRGLQRRQGGRGVATETINMEECINGIRAARFAQRRSLRRF
jgi:NAD(P)-dependent dehydrogenase (short-subunit alcohol dehydrogenase family)